MPAKKTSSGSDGDAPQGLTEGELRFIKAVFDNMTQKPDADWDAVAAALTLKDAKCAKERFRQMSVRHGWRNDGSSPRKNKAPAPAGGSGVAGDAKVTRKPRAPRKKAVKKDEDSDSEVKAEVKAEGTD
ncbi:hypothetical protein B0T10DRAFT_560400 [Thelonectria olida]|uniref:Myb-like domain-containing protein n=1 Tax=Thelonectria olida TaxID=1576542 RepID=A0A9P8W574_9HYPO|nr:hypothetical protein B0T10DRAFT_560400 [Thelonectria olida]